ncbi:Fe-S protein assembly co-chaperone HscB, partial [bacterium AH-315-I18]|nr:Fe-S protein assembly co-chaperone HscB [bacterium AH-315-I18]
MNPNPFTLLNLPVTFDVDAKALHRAFLQQSSANHPDRFIDPLKQADAADRTAVINKAYQTLKSPFDRATVMIHLLSEDPVDDSKQLPANLLMEMMEIREELEDAQANKNSAELKRLQQWAKDQEKNYLLTLKQVLDQATALPASDRKASLSKAIEQLNALRYIQRMLEEFEI